MLAKIMTSTASQRRDRVLQVGTAVLLLACVPASAFAQAQKKSESLYLLAATPTEPSEPRVYPATLYRLDADHRLKVVREIVPPIPATERLESGGVAAIRDDMQGRIYVVYPAVRSTTVSVIHEDRPAFDDRAAIPKGFFSPFSPAVGTSSISPGKSSLILPLERGGFTPDGTLHRVETLIVLAGDAPVSGNRLTQLDYTNMGKSPCLYPCPANGSEAHQTDWQSYQAFRFQGTPGGPTAPGYPPLGKTLQDHMVIPGPEGSWIPLDRTPPGFPTEKTPPHNPTIAVIAATDRYFAFAVTPEAGYLSLGLERLRIETVFIHDRESDTWKESKSPATVPVGRRIFGSWMATMVEIWINSSAEPDNPGRENERCCERVLQKGEMDSDIVYHPFVRELYPRFAARGISIPGTLLLDNLEDNRRITIQTGQEDSEILTVRDDGLVLYRVNDSIFAAQINGNSLSVPKLVIKDQDVPEVHWVFWSYAASDRAELK